MISGKKRLVLLNHKAYKGGTPININNKMQPIISLEKRKTMNFTLRQSVVNEFRKTFPNTVSLSNAIENFLINETEKDHYRKEIIHQCIYCKSKNPKEEFDGMCEKCFYEALTNKDEFSPDGGFSDKEAKEIIKRRKQNAKDLNSGKINTNKKRMGFEIHNEEEND